MGKNSFIAIVALLIAVAGLLWRLQPISNAGNAHFVKILTMS